MTKLDKSFRKNEKPTEKAIQFGEGNFLRGFVDWKINQLNEKSDLDLGIVVVQPRPGEKLQELNEQDGLYNVILEGIQNNEVVESVELITAITRGVDPYTQYQTYLELAHNDEMRYIFSNTTEAGIYFTEKDQKYEKTPESFPGKLTALLYERYKMYKNESNLEHKGFVIIPCELVENNGMELKKCVHQYIEYWNLERAFQEWVNEHNVFCNTLVDRIVSGYPVGREKEFEKKLGYEDQLLVVGEPFFFWAIEAPEHVQKELPLDCGVLPANFVEDIQVYRTRKVRILNGLHTLLTPLAYIKGYQTVGEAMKDEALKSFIYQLASEEILPTIDLSYQEKTTFLNEVMERFSNPYLQHYLQDIALNSISKFAVRVLPTINDYVESEQTYPKRIMEAFAYLLYFYKGESKDVKYPLNDDEAVLDYFSKIWKRFEQTNDIDVLLTSLLGNEELWGENLILMKDVLKPSISELIKIYS